MHIITWLSHIAQTNPKRSMSFKNSTFGVGEDLVNQIKAREMVDYIKDRMTSKGETKLRTRILPYDLKLAVRDRYMCIK